MNVCVSESVCVCLSLCVCVYVCVSVHACVCVRLFQAIYCMDKGQGHTHCVR